MHMDVCYSFCVVCVSSSQWGYYFLFTFCHSSVGVVVAERGIESRMNLCSSSLYVRHTLVRMRISVEVVASLTILLLRGQDKGD